MSYQQFLNCLFGSLRQKRHRVLTVLFLNCLFGSLLWIFRRGFKQRFLNCLFGSLQGDN
ncbi:hypothetical protein HMPREF0080_01365 [Anaeroglobus geminatus F0357]|uniref:Uncharacterized protein n=1 Tax=Anaeroglobus geminatus F0357 TaxID=861450 RepID=G9YI79_9FIRM|nr:hypothetical protein HMPREF0080_01365 [Anaeroglobus geminatus F0357]